MFFPQFVSSGGYRSPSSIRPTVRSLTRPPSRTLRNTPTRPTTISLASSSHTQHCFSIHTQRLSSLSDHHSQLSIHFPLHLAACFDPSYHRTSSHPIRFPPDDPNSFPCLRLLSSALRSLKRPSIILAKVELDALGRGVHRQRLLAQLSTDPGLLLAAKGNLCGADVYFDEEGENGARVEAIKSGGTAKEREKGPLETARNQVRC
jgi:hypothetical protein